MAIPEPSCCDGPNELLRKILLGLVEIQATDGNPITVEDEGVPLTVQVTSFDFVGAGVTATSVGDDVTVTIPGGGPPSGPAGGTLGGTYPNPSIATGGTGNFTPGSVIFAGATGGLDQDNANLFWDNLNNRLGIGTTVPSVQFTISMDGQARALLQSYLDPASSSSELYFYRGRGTNSIKTTVLNGDRVMRLSPQAYDGSGLQKVAEIRALVDGTVASGSVPGSLSFLTTPVGAANPTDRMWIGSNGNVGIGTTTPTAVLHLKAGTATASTAPLKLTSGTNLTTEEAGSMEYNGTNLFFTRSGTVRENVLVAVDNAAAPATNAIGVILDYYGTSATRVLTTPDRWMSVNILGVVYKVPLYL